MLEEKRATPFNFDITSVNQSLRETMNMVESLNKFNEHH